MQACNHVAAFYWHKYAKEICPASTRNGYHAVCMDYSFAAKDPMHAKKWFRH
jgi:hypothetical protein